MERPSQANSAQDRETLMLRLVWTLVFFCVWQLAEVALWLVALVQIGFRLLKGQPSTELQKFGDSLSQYIAQIGRFATFTTEQKPWPLAEWPAPSTRTDRARG